MRHRQTESIIRPDRTDVRWQRSATTPESSYSQLDSMSQITIMAHVLGSPVHWTRVPCPTILTIKWPLPIQEKGDEQGASAKRISLIFRCHMPERHSPQAEHTSYAAQSRTNNFYRGREPPTASCPSLAWRRGTVRLQLPALGLGSASVLRHLAHHDQVGSFQLFVCCLRVNAARVASKHTGGESGEHSQMARTLKSRWGGRRGGITKPPIGVEK